MDTFLLSALLLLVVASIGVTLSKSLGLGSILGLLIAGIIIGPYTPGPYVTKEVETLRHFAELGVILLLFIIGLEMQPKKLWSMRIKVFGMGGLQVVVTGFAIGFYMNQTIEPTSLAFALGFTLALSSTAFVMQLLQEKGEVASVHGRSSFAILLFQDLAIVPLLAILPMIAGSSDTNSQIFSLKDILLTLGVILLVFIFGKIIAPFAFEKVAKQRNTEAFIFIVILSVILSSYLMEQIGLSMALGAFVMGMLLSTSKYKFQIQASIEPFRGILMSIFFIAVGMSINVESLFKSPLEIVQNIVVIFAIKIFFLFGIAFLFRHSLASAVRMSFLLGQCGEFGFVLFGSAKGFGLIDEHTFTMGMGVISISMLITPIMYNFGLKIADKLTKSHAISYIKTDENDSAKVVIAGYGDTGKIVGSMLKHVHIDFVAIDNNIEIVKKAKSLGENVFFGNIADDNLLDAIKIEQAQIVIISVDQGRSAIEAIAHIKEKYPHINIIARSSDINNMNKMFRLGANTVVAERAEGSLHIGSRVLLDLGIEEDDVVLLQEAYRKNDYELLGEIHQ